MARGGEAREVRGPGRGLLGWRDRVYLLALLAPFVAYDLMLKGLRVALRPEHLGLADVFGLMRSDVLFDLGYVALWVALFATVRKRPLRRIVVVLFHAVTVLVALVDTGAYRYFRATGSTLDRGTILYALSSLGGTHGVIGSEVTPLLVVVVVVVLAYLLLGPWLLTRLVGRRFGRSETRPRASSGVVSWPTVLGVGLVAYALFAFSALPDGPAAVGKSFSRDAFVNVAMGSESGPPVGILPGSSAEKAPLRAKLLAMTSSKRRNVVIVHLESTRAESVTPYDHGLKTTPFLDELSKKSIFAERAYAVVPHTSNALTATICGIYPPLDPRGTDSLGDSIPGRCLPQLLKNQGYRSVYFSSSVKTFERRPELVRDMSYDEFYPVETMDTKGFEQANYFGYEDDVMLKPSERWLRSHADKPFLATYETVTPHHDYRTPQRYGMENFAKDDTLNRYQNSVRYVDFFLKNLFDQYKRLGLYDNTIFVIYGDHGEGFGEHGLYQHDNTIYEEGLRIPLLVVAPEQFPQGERVQQTASQIDVLPTITDLLGFRIEDGKYPGSSLLALPKDRTLKFSCWSDETCLASLKGSEKYVYHYDNQPDEVFDLAKDPLEKHNLAGGKAEETKKRKAELFAWRAGVDATYADQARKPR